MSEMNTFNDSFGEVNISPHVIETIAKLSTVEIEGVVDINGGFASEIAEFLGRNNRGIKVSLDDEDTSIDLSITIKNGYVLTDLAEKVQENVKNTVENMTGLNVSQVNVHINGIEFDEPENE